MIFVCYKTSVMILVHGNTKSFLSRILIHSCCLNQQIDVCTVIISYVVSERFVTSNSCYTFVKEVSNAK